MQELRDKIKNLSLQINKAIETLNLKDKAKKLQELKALMSATDFWNDQDKARIVSSEASVLEGQINSWQEIKKNIDNLKILAQDQQAEDLLVDLNKDFDKLNGDYKNLSEQLFFSGEHDNSSAIITINAGAGGVDAQDWAELLERMYLRFAEQNNWTLKYLSRSAGSEAGIKSSTFKVSGQHVYGYLKHEAGVHRLVRLSPFDADHARHTSFAMVEVLPEIDQTEVDIKEEDLKVDTFRASGHGGQSVNTTDSAVRIIHITTGLTASCQNERSQLQNKKQALSYLSSKVQKYYQAERDDEKKALKGEYTQAAWGNQIRSYVLHPYKMVKDHRTNFEVADPNKVLDGQVMPFIKASLEAK
ncbi:peptide chain release factor 2 [bacterium]|nr:peptide chain release factor 2 [bacterium]